MKVIDLSLPYDYPTGDEPAGRYTVDSVRTAEQDGVAGCRIDLFNHFGTHVDAPAHLIPAGWTVDRYDAGTWVGPAVVLGLPRAANEPVTAADIRAAAPGFGGGDMVLIGTGWDHRHREAEYATHHPYLSLDAAEYLIARGVTVVGMDVQSVDLGHSLRPPGFRYTSLRTLLEAGVPVVHSLANLEQLAGLRVTASMAPVNFAGLDGAPVRAFALLDGEGR